MNLACDKALLVAYTEDATKIDQRMVMEGIREIEGSEFSFRAREREEAQDGVTDVRRRPFIRMPFLGGRYR